MIASCEAGDGCDSVRRSIRDTRGGDLLALRGGEVTPAERAERATRDAMRIGVVEWHARDNLRDIRRREVLEEIQPKGEK